MKDHLRQHYWKKRHSLPVTLKIEASRAIFERFKTLPLAQKAQRVFVYLSTPNEVETRPLIQWLLEQNKSVFAPKTNDAIQIARLHSLDQLETGAFGIQEPLLDPNNPLSHKELDLILVPGVAFDAQGHRIGMGKGFYDRFLKKTRGIKIGLAFSQQIAESIPIDPHDVDMDFVLTPQKLFTPSPNPAQS